MQEQVKEILEMTKCGQISVDEASRLIEALNKRTSSPEEKKSTSNVDGDKDARSGFKMDQDLDSIGKFVEKLLSIPALKKSIDSATKAATKVSKSHDGTRLSQFEEPTGESFSFEDNSINLSTFSGTSLSHSSFCDNSINASSIQNLAMVRSEIVDGSFNATSLDQFHLSDAKIDGTSFSGSRVRECTLEQSEFTDASFSGCSLRDVVISQHSKVTDCSMSHL
jgi:hypothetical protein